jgi:putative transcriptional regulator
MKNVTEEDPELQALADSVFAHDAPAPAGSVRDHVLALAQAPRGDVDVADYPWTEIAPGIRAFEMRNDARVRACLIWADAGAVHPRHRHLGEEDILILRGRLRDERGTYGPGQVCRSRRGEIHSETITTDADCVCFAVYYDGGIEPV